MQTIGNVQGFEILNLSSIYQSNYSSISLIYHISPATSCTLIPIALVLESKKIIQSPFFDSTATVLAALGYTCIGGVMAFVLLLVEVVLVKRTSALSVNIGANVKDLLQIGLSMMVFGDVLTPVNALGLSLAFTGTVCYTLHKNARNNAAGAPVYRPLEKEETGIETIQETRSYIVADAE